jgi:ATP-dependent DNA ligase
LARRVRILARRDAKGVRLYTRNGNDFTKRFPLVVAAVATLPVSSCLIDGEAIVSDDSGLAVFELIRSFRHDHAAVLCAFDLLELDGQDLRRVPIKDRKARLARLLPKPLRGMAVNEYFAGDGAVIFAHACKLGCEGIVSKRMGSTYRSGRSKHWIKVKNPAAPAVRREAGEDWGRRRARNQERRLPYSGAVPSPRTMRIATFNINNINKRLTMTREIRCCRQIERRQRCQRSR